jgi:Ca2+-binding RTX toxin-like protein
VSAHVTAGNDANHTDDAATSDTSVSSCTILGTFGDDRLRAHGGDVVCGLEGNDTINARNGKADSIDGGPGVDTATVDAIDRVRHVEHVRRARRAH